MARKKAGNAVNQRIFVSAVVVARNGDLLCQLRDDIPGIIHPGCWTSSPGGTLEKGETPEEAIAREMLEEFNAKIKDVEPLTTFKLKGKFAGSYFIFSAKLDSPRRKVCCNEGQRVAFFSPLAARKLKQPPLVRKILMIYIAKLHAR